MRPEKITTRQFNPLGISGQDMRQDYFKEFDAVTLYCPRCRRPVEVKKQLLLVLPGGDKYHYTCPVCGSSLGSKMDKARPF